MAKTATPAAPVLGTTAAVINCITASPGIKRPKLIIEVRKAVPAVTDKKVNDLLYQMASVGKIKTHGDGDERSYHLGSAKTAKPAKSAPKAKLVTGHAASQVAASTKKSARPRRSPPPTAAVPASLDHDFRFAFGIRQNGGIAIAKNGQTIELQPEEVRLILTHANA